MTFLAAIALCPGFGRADPVPPEILTNPPAADVIILGEVHDNPHHHGNQAQAVARVAPAAVVWEMLTPDQAGRMPRDRLNAGRVAEALGWAGWPDFALYHPIVLAARDAHHYGGGLPRTDVRRAFDLGAAGVFGDDAARYGLSAHLPEGEQAVRAQIQFEAHCQAMPMEMMGGMVEAQRLRDAALARAVVRAMAETGGPVVVITGNGHARTDWAVPAVLRRAAPELTVWSLAQVESDPGPGAPWDAWLLTEAQDRADPCLSLTGG